MDAYKDFSDAKLSGKLWADMFLHMTPSQQQRINFLVSK